MAQVPNGTYVPCSDIAKSMYIEKVVFNANQVTIYFGTMGISIGFEKFNYEAQEMNKKLPLVQVYFEYDKTNDILIFGEAYTNSTLGNMLSQMGNSAKLIYNKSGNCNPNLVSSNKIRILVKDNNQDVTTEIINNYLKLSDANNIIPYIDKAGAIKSGKYTDAQIEAATKVLRDALNNYFQGIQNKIAAANLILTQIGNNSVAIVDGMAKIYSYFVPSPALETPEYLKDFGLTQRVYDWIVEIIQKQMPTPGEYIGPDLNNSVKNVAAALDVFGGLIQSLINQNNTINK